MASRNPVFARNRALTAPRGVPGNSQAGAGSGPIMSEEQLQNLYNQPAAGPAQTGRMTYDDVMIRTAGLFGILLLGGAVGWFVPALFLPSLLIGVVLGFVNIFKREPSPALIIAYAAFQGMFLGGFSMFMERMYEGIVIQAVLATLSVFGVMLALFASGKVRVTKKFTRFFMLAIIGYAAFSLVNLVYMIASPGAGMFGMHSMEITLPIVGTFPLGVLIGAFAILLASYALVMDFDDIQRGVRNGIARKYAWSCAFGLMVTLIWLYTEMLRLLALLRGSSN
ncbi:Bax inhibitor-1/YccA family protein [Saxibacter everestensis]|uniref:Bax inhibitor-1/YccA family protein n=1 Tax=Saxibacter everestensis TaxID=2909229 RepID=A0ABY8QP65_9MICO|nr:Bax inhibitor-1/YccA family protein [Brevibacteriaceae bacterium ZFBP1038]